MALSETQRQAFADRGVVRLNGAFPESDAGYMVDKIWSVLEQKFMLRRNAPETWTENQPTGFQSLTRAGAFEPIVGPVLRDALDDLLGEGRWGSTEGWGAPLITFPQVGRKWDVPRAQWHIDFPARGAADELPGVRVLAFVAPVDPGGGGTVVATGTHRLVERLLAHGQGQTGNSATLRASLAQSHAWLRALWSGSADNRDRISHFMANGAHLDGVDVRVEELSGSIGDVILMHPWTFHAPAPNCGRKPRFMVGHSVFRNATII